MKRFLRLWQIARVDFRILIHAVRDPRRPRWLLPVVGVLALYLVSPFNLINDFLPVIGLFDDAVLFGLAVHWLVRLLPADVLADARARVGGARASA